METLPTVTGAKKSVNLNSNDAVGNFGIYEIKMDGVLHKYGKAHLDRITDISGNPTRLHQQLIKLAIDNPDKLVEGKVIDILGEVTTKAAKDAEKAYLQAYYNLTKKVPDGNKKSFKPLE